MHVLGQVRSKEGLCPDSHVQDGFLHISASDNVENIAADGTVCVFEPTVVQGFKKLGQVELLSRLTRTARRGEEVRDGHVEPVVAAVAGRNGVEVGSLAFAITSAGWLVALDVLVGRVAVITTVHHGAREEKHGSEEEREHLHCSEVGETRRGRGLGKKK